MAEVVLVCMPYGPAFSPSIGLSLLQAGLARHGIAARVRYFSLDFAERLGQQLYRTLAVEGRLSMVDLAGEWTFAEALFGAQAPPAQPYLDEILEDATPALRRKLFEVRARVEPFLDDCLAELVVEKPRIVGFTSVFQQHVASLALARRLKEALPDTFVVFGGANCEDVMGAETVRRFPFVDAAVSGEGDLVFPELVRRVLDGRSVTGLPGVRTAGEVEKTGRLDTAPLVRDMDALPHPDYRDFFAQFGKSRFDREWMPSLFFETARGCWWGERQHCTFCGLNGNGMAFRSKSPSRALGELLDLAARHPGCDVQVTDNILDMAYFKEFLPRLAEHRLDLGLYWETKANLRKDQLRVMRDAGIRKIQPGIESFSDEVLKLMRKGVSALQNLQLLKWCRELGVFPYWNVLWGFPGESPAEYERMTALVPLLSHLPAPAAFGGIRLDRFSPNFFDAEALGFRDVRPLPAYRHVYPFPEESLARLACYFGFEYREPRDVYAYVEPLHRALKAWKKAAPGSAFFSVDTGELLCAWDLRPGGRPPLTALRGRQRLLYLACDTARDPRQLSELLARSGHDPSPDLVAETLAPLVAQGLMVHDGVRYLALAVPLGEYQPSAEVVARFRDVARTLGRHPTEGLRVRTARGRGRRALEPASFSLDHDGSLLIR